MMPTDFPPPEIIEALEEQLEMDFVHYTVSIEGIVEGVFSDGFDKQIVSFEAKRDVVPHFQLPPIESLIAELDEKALKKKKKMFKSIIEEIDNMAEQSEELSFDGTTPKFDGEWYCP